MKTSEYSADKIFNLLSEFRNKAKDVTCDEFFTKHKIIGSTFYYLRMKYGLMTLKQIERFNELEKTCSTLKPENKRLLRKYNAAKAFIKDEFDCHHQRRKFAKSVVDKKLLGPKPTCELFSITDNSFSYDPKK